MCTDMTDLPPAKKPNPALFWIALLAPAVLALLSFLCASGGPSDFGVTVGLAGAGAGLVSSVYCGIWLARRFVKPGNARVLFALAMVALIGILNLIIVVAGCAANISFH
jgi:hypothetical protein